MSIQNLLEQLLRSGTSRYESARQSDERERGLVEAELAPALKADLEAKARA